jgi:hypothetical protein
LEVFGRPRPDEVRRELPPRRAVYELTEADQIDGPARAGERSLPHEAVPEVPDEVANFSSAV